jgi:hypothetical protein
VPRNGPRRRARDLIGLFALTVAVSSLFLLVRMDVQTVSARELAARRSDAIAFFTVDYAFVVLYAMLGPLALWRFGTTLPSRGGRVPSWVAIGAVALAVGGLFDLVENSLLLASSSSVRTSLVDLAHVLAWPKYAFGGLGFVLAAVGLGHAIRRVRGRGVA